MSVEDCRAALPLAVLWTKLGLPHAEKVGRLSPGGNEVKICSPFRPDKNPSFSVWIIADGVGFCKDHGDGEKAYDEVGLIERAKGVSNKDAIKLYHEMAGLPWGRSGESRNPFKKAKKKVAKKAAKKEAKASPVNVVPFQEQEPAKPKGKGKLGKLVKEYHYHDAEGNLAHQTLRFEPKSFRQRRPAREGEDGADREGWVWSLKDAEVFPYRLPELLASSKDDPVFLVEGEKDVDNLVRAGMVATTLPMGAGKWRDEYAQWFIGRWVVIIPDYDPVGKDGKRVGEEGARTVAGKLLDCSRVGMLELSEIWDKAKEGQDVSDWLESRWEMGITEDVIQKHLVDLAELATVPEELAFDGCLVPEEGQVVFEDKIARRLVKVGGFMYCGSSFWRWDAKGGLWEKLDGRLLLENKVREAMRAAKAEKKISHSKVKSIVGLAESENFCVPEELNQQPEGWLCVRNGMLDVMSGELHPHRPHWKTTVQCPHDYEPHLDCPNWKEWLADRQPDEETQKQIQEMFGYCLVTDVNYHSFFFLYGDGGTGKSTCVKVLEELVGTKNIKSMELEELDNPFTRAGLVGKSLYLCKELTASSFKHVGLIKAIVSGDRISADVKYGRGFDFIPKGRLVMESNVIAATPDSSSGFSRRFIQISWDRPIEVIDYGLEQRLIDEASGILNWALEGYRRLRARGRFEHTARSAEATKQLLLHRAQVPSFLESERVEDLGAGADVKSDVADLFGGYREWCEDHDVVPFYKERPAFLREVLSRKPMWRARKKQARGAGGERSYVIQGLKVKRDGNEDYELQVG